MKNDIFVQLDADTAKSILGGWERERDEMRLKLNKLEERISKLKDNLVGTEKSDSSQSISLPLAITPAKKGKGGRAKKGESEKVIIEFLSSPDGEGSTMSEIPTATGVSYSTANRIINSLLHSGKIRKQRKAFFVN